MTTEPKTEPKAKTLVELNAELKAAIEAGDEAKIGLAIKERNKYTAEIAKSLADAAQKEAEAL
jgi:hypothetical protein